jgi:signal transduction histidine kinase
MHLEIAREAVESADQCRRLTAALDSLRRGIVEGRQVIRGVRSAVLDDLGLTAGIHDLVDQMAAFGIAVEVALSDGLDAIPKELQTTVYRVVQESLTNVRKHAETARATVHVHRMPDELLISVSDPGKGFDVQEPMQRGFGIVGMTERVRLAGGTCEITSKPGTGSCVSARLSVPA